VKRLVRILALVLAVAATPLVQSSTASEGTLQDMHFMSNGVVLVYHDRQPNAASGVLFMSR
jgi:hypothetical protein